MASITFLAITYLCLGSIDLLFNSVKNSIVNTFQTLDGFLNESLFIISKNIDNKTVVVFLILKPYLLIILLRVTVGNSGLIDEKFHNQQLIVLLVYFPNFLFQSLPSIRPEHVFIRSNINNNSLTKAEASRPLHKSGSNTSSINPKNHHKLCVRCLVLTVVFLELQHQIMPLENLPLHQIYKLTIVSIYFKVIKSGEF
ncbi:hypothetical protein AGLY_006251 [Aphis glycines]|uniref:Uncharacterized protein n=1 Tax=Aphis glycines TaxID=307491 RepID=A0A6G0TRS3_APHGL|nr:hypothetical protein AGLY_006251 [Aphis glycines]